MNEFNLEYTTSISKIRLLEIKIKRIDLTKDYLNTIKPSFFYVKKKKKWQERLESLLLEELEVYNSLQLEYEKLGKIL